MPQIQLLAAPGRSVKEYLASALENSETDDNVPLFHSSRCNPARAWNSTKNCILHTATAGAYVVGGFVASTVIGFVECFECVVCCPCVVFCPHDYVISPEPEIENVSPLQYYFSRPLGGLAGIVGCFTGGLAAVALSPITFLVNSCRYSRCTKEESSLESPV